MAGKPHFDTAELKQQSSRDLLRLLQDSRGKKNVVLQRSLAGTINLLAKFSTLQSQGGVDRIFWLEDNHVDSSQRSVVFIANGERPANAQLIARQVRRLQGSHSIDHDFRIIWVPRRTLLADQLLEGDGVLGDITVQELPLYFRALDTDLLSLELADSYGKLYLDRDVSPIFLAAKGLMTLQVQYGLFPRITGRGDYARRLADLLLRMRTERSISEGSSSSALEPLMPSEIIENLIVIDREADPLSPFLTQLTYEGLLDELYGVENGQVEVDATLVGATSDTQSSGETIPQAAGGRKKKIQLDTEDPLYRRIRGSNFSVVGSQLYQTAKRLEVDLKRPNTKSTGELKEFVQRLPKLQAEQGSLKVHTAIAEDVTKKTEASLFRDAIEVQQNLIAGSDISTQSDAIHNLMARGLPVQQILRILCVASLTAGGLRAKDFESLKQAVIHSYGFQHLLTLNALTEMSLFTASKATSATSYLNPLSAMSSSSLASAAAPQTSYNTLRVPLKLIDDEVNEAEPSDISYAYSGYAPLSIRLVQCALQKPTVLALSKSTDTSTVNPPAQGWRPFDDLLKSVKGASFSEIQRADDQLTKARAGLVGNQVSLQEKVSFVFILGGITRSELAALRLVGERLKGKRRIVVGTTGFISGDRAVEVAMARSRRAE